ncbi:hypothetical protein [Mesorhizobium sp. CAU 1732]|uniref:hypothetical protein n=1 Tax=Mesorhizobium sp. CAU 1732 TaxID=3140358 RepID=UPI003260BAE3
MSYFWFSFLLVAGFLALALYVRAQSKRAERDGQTFHGAHINSHGNGDDSGGGDGGGGGGD